jgi:hypothetical protein
MFFIECVIITRASGHFRVESLTQLARDWYKMRPSIRSSIASTSRYTIPEQENGTADIQYNNYNTSMGI